MKQLKNLILIIILVSIITIITCSSYTIVESEWVGSYVVFEYPVPDGMITESKLKEEMISRKIKNLEETNRIYWGDFPDEKHVLIETYGKILDYIEKNYVGFKGLEIDWFGFKDKMLNKAENIGSYGDYLTLLTKTGFILKEGHTRILSALLNSKIHKRLQSFDLIFKEHAPIMMISGIRSRIGACYVITDKNELVINRLLPNDNSFNKKKEGMINPYSLRIGDEIVGFNGIPWEEWYPRLIEADIPIYGSAGSSEEARKKIFLKSAMFNSDLFEKINIKRYDTGKIETIDIVYIEQNDNYGYNLCTDYIGEIPNIPTPKLSLESYLEYSLGLDNILITHGIIEENNIGYIYLNSFPVYKAKSWVRSDEWDPYETDFSNKFEKVILSMMDTDGLIIDLRFNLGGRQEVIYKGLSHLLNVEKDINLFISLIRNSKNKEDLTDLVVSDELKIFPLLSDKPNLFYDKPIVILTGPNCMSGCDVIIALLSRFSNFSIIGSHNNGSIAYINPLQNYKNRYYIGDWRDKIQVIIPLYTLVFSDKPDEYLLRKSDFIDYFVYPTKEDIINGVDTVREFAIDYILENN